METAQEYYQQQGPMTACDKNALGALPKDVAGMCKVIQGVLVHRDIAPFVYGLHLTEQRRDEAHLRSMPDMLRQIEKLDSRPLGSARELDHRMASVCRHFSVMLCAMLRDQGVPARARCGFGAYFTRGKFEDHWVAEYWNAKERRWIMVDAQLDSKLCSMLQPDFDPLDVPRNRFIVGGDAWQMCRSGREDASKFGLTHAHLQGLWFVAGNVVRDLASLNRIEMLPWDVWGGAMAANDKELDEGKVALLDKIAALTIGGDDRFAEIRAIYQDERLRVPPVVFNALRNAPEPTGVNA
jgi:Transglutaminase-like superfamily